jgi:hypothetical protein
MEVGAPDDAIAAEAVGSPEDIVTEESDTKLLEESRAYWALAR